MRSLIAAVLFLTAPQFALASAVPADTGKASTDSSKKKSDELPLKTTRTLSFDTDEGTWLSLDVSPDGSTLVFELDGDLYSMPIAGGTATRLTSGPAFDSQPRYSPDGKHIVFLSDRSGGENIWICEADGSHPKALTKGMTNLYASPEWTPDGNYIVASRTSGFLGSVYELWLYHKDGGSGQSLTPNPVGAAARGPAANSLGPAFGSDPRYIWFARKRGGFGYNLQFPLWELAVYDRETGKTFNQTDVYGSAMRPTLSPDGKWLVYATRHDAETGLRIRNIASGDEKWLAYPVQRDDQESRFTRDLEPGMSFTPDSKALIAAYAGKIHRIDVATGQATVIPFTAHVEQQLGPLVRFQYRVDTGDVLVRQIRNAAPSPDGSRLVFSALDRLYLMDLPRGTPRRLTSDAVHEQAPAWSPDGQWIAYVTWTNDQGGDLYKTRADGKGKPVRLNTAPAFFDTPAWSPDGQKIVVVRGTRASRVDEHFAPGYELDWIPAAGGPATLISKMNPSGRPHFLRDPNRVFVYDGEDGLISMRLDGTDRRAYIKVTGYTYPAPGAEANSADEILIAPDSASVLAQVNNNVYLVTLPEVGGQTPTINVSDPNSASFPVKRLTHVGGDFIGWSANGRSVYWSIGRSFFRWTLAAADSAAKAKAAADSLRADSLKGDTTARGKPDSAAKARVDSLAKLPAYEPERVDVAITVPRDVPRGTVVLRGARIITMKGDEVIEGGDVVVTDNRIACVGAKGACTAPAGAKVYDVSGKTIMPGLVDGHAHPWPTWGIHETQVWKYLANLAWGVTTTRDPQTATTDVLTYADQVETGELLGPRIFHTGPGVFSDENPQSLDDARNTLRRYSDFYHTNTIKEYMTGNRRQRQWIIMAAQELHLMPTTEGGLDYKMNLTEALDGYPGHEHAYPITPLFKDNVQLIAQSGINYNPTLLVSYGGPWSENYFYEHYDIHEDPKIRRFIPHEEIDDRALRRSWFRDDQYVFPRIAASAASIIHAGGFVGMGCHGQLDGLGCHWELWALSAGGLTPLEVLRAGTWDGAHAIGFEQDLGSIEPGKLADLLVLDKNPLDDIHNTNTIQWVMKNGRIYEAATLNEIWPRQKPLPQMWWWGQEPDGK
ncbi:MAG TPA: amidohydrolase family protein [Gemmatimonadales bacterium]|nr:amidohydrolase family protein [Gemmatimonadales bacterium]